MQRIVIVGGGVGGTMLANLLVVRLYPEILGGEVQVLLISDSPDHYYKPAFMYL
ncbi:NAD(P)/FAD-dependent oxidoreductase, partial [Klebsiella pneumoniae]